MNALFFLFFLIIRRSYRMQEISKTAYQRDVTVKLLCYRLITERQGNQYIGNYVFGLLFFVALLNQLVKDTIFGRHTFNIECVFLYSLQLLLDTSELKKNLTIYLYMFYVRHHGQCLLFCFDFNQTWICQADFVSCPHERYNRNPSSGCGQTDGETGTKQLRIRHFSQLL